MNGSLYAGWTDGRLYGRTFNGSALGPQRDLLAENGYVIGPNWISFANVSGMYWEAGRLYYTRQGDARLFYRYFSPESELIDSVQHVASGNGDGFNWSTVRGVTYADGAIFYAAANGDLHRVGADALGDPIAGTDVVIAGPGVDGVNYASERHVHDRLTRLRTRTYGTARRSAGRSSVARVISGSRQWKELPQAQPP